MLAMPMAELPLAGRMVRASEASDEALVEAYLRGDSEAFGLLVRRYDRLVYSLVRRYASTPEDAKDLAQRAFLKSFEASRRVLPRLVSARPQPFKAWLLRIAVNVGKNHARDARRWAFEPIDGAVEAGGASAQERLEKAEQRARTRAAVLLLPKRQREVFTLRIDGELPFAEIAQTLGITENNAKVHFHHAMKRLQAAVTEGAR
jgi:RNA polymerase sigma-70 factor (ECF subfamily)